MNTSFWKSLSDPSCVCYNNAMKKAHIGSNFDDFLQQEGLLAECEASALRRLEKFVAAEVTRFKSSKAEIPADD